MHYQISHTTTYAYSQSVALHPHLIRLHPRSDGHQSVRSFSLLVSPTPLQQSQVLDLDGNVVVKVWFEPEKMVDKLTIQVLSHVETHRSNPFNYLLEPWAMKLPLDYPSSLLAQLQPYVGGSGLYPAVVDPVAVQLAQELSQRVQGDLTGFLMELNQLIYTNCRYSIRETGAPLPPGMTWSQKAGSCRDYAVLFMDVCRAVGLAARFVSGYQEGDPDEGERHLHAWAEVYLPGAGWCGYDPTHGLAVADTHVALAASAIAQYTAPVVGGFGPVSGTQAQMTYQLMMQRLDAPTAQMGQSGR